MKITGGRKKDILLVCSLHLIMSAIGNFTMRLQRTLKTPIRCSGIGLHSGHRVNLRLLPAPADTGILFLRKKTDAIVPVQVGGDKVVGTELCTAIGENGTRIQTVEHLLSALSGLQVDNLLIELDSGELPILDGSAEPFVALILKAGIKQQERPQKVIRMIRSVTVEDGDKFITVHPFDRSLVIDCTIRFERPIRIHQRLSYTASPETFIREIARARTFGFLDQVQQLWSRGLAKGGSLDNAVVISEKGVVNQEGLRFGDEFVRHKVLDLIGDLSLLGRPLIGRVEAYCPGHQLNTRLVSQLISSPDCWVLDEGGEAKETVPALSLKPATSVAL
jgi:UDP-3-O-[3-hydroxymyristoyl] N-acetylglucosamine deacetylase